MAKTEYHIKTTRLDGSVMTNPWDEGALKRKVHNAKIQKLIARIEKIEVDGSIADQAQKFAGAEVIEIIWEAPVNPAVAKELGDKDREIQKLKKQLEKAEKEASAKSSKK